MNSHTPIGEFPYLLTGFTTRFVLLRLHGGLRDERTRKSPNPTNHSLADDPSLTTED